MLLLFALETVLVAVCAHSINKNHTNMLMRYEAGSNVRLNCAHLLNGREKEVSFWKNIDERRWTKIDNGNNSIDGYKIWNGVLLIDAADVTHSAFYKCVSGDDGKEKFFQLFVYDLQLNWIYTCPSDGSAQCTADYERNKIYVLENSTVTFGCTSFYSSTGSESVELRGKVPAHWVASGFNNETRNDRSSSQSKRWKVTIGRADAKKSATCELVFLNESGLEERLAALSFLVEVRDAKNPNALLSNVDECNIFDTLTTYRKTIAFLAWALGAFTLFIFLFYWKKRAKDKKNVDKVVNKSRERSNSILLSRVRDKRLLSGAVTGYSLPVEFCDRSRVSSVATNSFYTETTDSEHEEVNYKFLPNRPPPRLSR